MPLSNIQPKVYLVLLDSEQVQDRQQPLQTALAEQLDPPRLDILQVSPDLLPKRYLVVATHIGRPHFLGRAAGHHQVLVLLCLLAHQEQQLLELQEIVLEHIELRLLLLLGPVPPQMLDQSLRPYLLADREELGLVCLEVGVLVDAVFDLPVLFALSGHLVGSGRLHVLA